MYRDVPSINSIKILLGESKHIESVLSRFKNELHWCFALDSEKLGVLLQIEKKKAQDIHSRFDTNTNDLVDSYEIISAVIMLSNLIK